MKRLSVLAVLLSGCFGPLPEGDLSEDARRLFRDFEADELALVETLEHMDAVMDGLDLEAGRKKRLTGLPALTEDFFGGADVPAGIDTSNQLTAGIVGMSEFGVTDNLRAQVQVNMTCANATTVTCHERLAADETEDAQAFLDGDAEYYRTENTIRIETALDFWIQAPVDFRRVTLSDGRQAAVARTWLRESFDNDNGKHSWEQRFGLDVFIEQGGKTRRFYATWIGPDPKGFFSRPFIVPAIRRGLDEGFEQPDAWLETETCDVVLDDCMADAPF